MQVSLVIKSAKGIPKLGLSNSPSSYIIVQFPDWQATTGIAKNTCNPVWNYRVDGEAKSMLDPVKFYLYNSNSNDVDELLGYNQIEYEVFLTRVQSTSRIRLKDKQNNFLNVFIEVEHIHLNPPNYNSYILTPQTAIKLSLLSITSDCSQSIEWLSTFSQKCLDILHGSQKKQLDDKTVSTSLCYEELDDCLRIHLLMRGNDLDTVQAEGSVLIGNLYENCSFRVKMWYKVHLIDVVLKVNIIPNGFLPPKFNTLQFSITNLKLEPLAKSHQGWVLLVNTAFGTQKITQTNKVVELYVENNTNLQLEYFEEWDDALRLQPFAYYTIPINSINWSKELKGQEHIKMYNQMKAIYVNISINVQMRQIKSLSNIKPQYYPPIFSLNESKRTLKINQIKMSGAFFNELFPQKTVFYFVYFSVWGKKVIFPAFPIKNSSEYSINCSISISQVGEGELCLITYDHFLGKEQNIQAKEIENFVLFRIPTKKFMQIKDSKIIFTDEFLSFSKKITITKPCKRFDQMIKDRSLQIKIESTECPTFESGLLTIQNCIVQGAQSKVTVSIIFDSNELVVKGECGNFLMDKSYSIYLKDSGVQFRLQAGSNPIEMHYDLPQIIGNPQKNKLYKISIPMGQKSLTIIYKFEAFVNTGATNKKSRTLNETKRFSNQIPMHIQIKNAFLSGSYNSCTLRVTKGLTTYESLEEQPKSSFLRFRGCQKMYFDKQSENEYIFFTFYCKGLEGNLSLFVGHFNVSHIIGKGIYQINLPYLGQEKKSPTLITFEVLNDTFLKQSAARLTIKNIKFSETNCFKNFMKYYLVGEVKNSLVYLMEVNKTANKVIGGQQIFIRNGDNVSWYLYCATRPITKENYWNQQKQIIGSGKLMWVQLQSIGVISLHFLPTKDLISKFNANQLAILQRSVNVELEYVMQPIQVPHQQIHNVNAKPIDLDVLSSGGAILNILQVFPYCSHQKTIELKLLPFQFDLCVQSRISLNQEFIVSLPKMKLKLGICKSKKSGERYQKESLFKEINLKGKRIRTNEKFGLSINFPGICLVKADITVVNSKFTSNCKGVFKLIKCGWKSDSIKQVEVFPIKNYHEKSDYKNLPGCKIPNDINLNVDFITSQITFALFFVVTLKSSEKVYSVVDLAKIHIEKLEQKIFRHEWVIQGNQGKQSFLFYLQGNYLLNRVELIEEKFLYHLQGQNQNEKIEINHKSRQIIEAVKASQQIPKFRPDRKRGFRIYAQLPEAIRPTSVSVVLADKKVVQLIKSEHNYEIYTYKSYKQLKIEDVLIESDKVQMIERLERKQFTQRFLINRDPMLLVNLTSQPYAIADSKPQSITFNFQLHSIFSKQSKSKILWLANSKNDQILTKNFCLIVKHGRQIKMIRQINQNGQLQELSQALRFGYYPSIDQLEVYLCISNFFNQAEDINHPNFSIPENWTKTFPVAYGKMNLEKIESNCLVGCFLKKIENQNETLDRQLNKIIVCQNLNCLGSIWMSNRRWGHIKIQLLDISSLQLDSCDPSDLVSFSFEAEVTGKRSLSLVTTEARAFYKVQHLMFLNKTLEFVYFQEQGESETLKITATIFQNNKTFKLFEKRVDLSEDLRQPGIRQISTQVKVTQAKGLKSLVQMKFKFQNSEGPSQQMSIIEEARKINKVDIVSFENLSEKDMILKLFQCQQISHFEQVLTEIKESVIYSNKSQDILFKACGLYLQFQNNQKVISTILQMMNIELLKHQQTISKLNQEDISQIYEYLKIIFAGKLQERPKLLKRVNTIQYDRFVQQLDLDRLDQNIKYQKQKLFNGEEMQKVSTLTDSQTFLKLIQIMISKSKRFKQLFLHDINDWEQEMTFKEDKYFEKFLIFLQMIFAEQKIPIEISERVFQKALKKKIQPQILFQLWSKLPKEKLKEQSQFVLTKTVNDLKDMDKSQGSQALRSFMNYGMMHKVQMSSLKWEEVNQISLEVLKSSPDFQIINSYGEMILKLISLNSAENIKGEMHSICKKRLESEKDKNVKLVLNNLITKSSSNKVDIGGDPGNKKSNYHKKYLITS